MIQEGGNARFMAPELSNGMRENFRSSQASDIFALSMTFLSIWTRQPPFHEVQSARKVTTLLREGDRPTRPTRPLGLPFDVEANFWALIVKLWAQEPRMRPPSEEVLGEIERVFGWSAEEEAVFREREPFEVNPASHRDTLAWSLNNPGYCLHQSGRYDEACAPYQEAVTLKHELFEAKRRPHRAVLAAYLNNFGRSLHKAGRHSEACDSYREAVLLRRELFEVDRGPHRPLLALYLGNLGRSLHKSGRYSEAYHPYREAVMHQRELFEAEPGPTMPCLHCISMILDAPSTMLDATLKRALIIKKLSRFSEIYSKLNPGLIMLCSRPISMISDTPSIKQGDIVGRKALTRRL